MNAQGNIIKLCSLESIALPHALNGETGDNRSQMTPKIPVNHDLDAIYCWLSRVNKEQSPHTYRAYKREAERLLLWSLAKKGKALSSLNTVDLNEYREFLLDPQPESFWIGPKRPKSAIDWKPFTGPLSTRSVKHTDTIIRNLFGFLTDQHYLSHNPCSAQAKVKDGRKSGSIDVNRSLSHSEWEFIKSFLTRKTEKYKNKEDQKKWCRTQLIVLFLYATGLRIHEIAKAKLGDIVKKERKNKVQFWLSVVGKGGIIREVPLPKTTYQLLGESYLLITGLSFGQVGDEAPIIPSLRGNKHGANCIKPLAIHKILKECFDLAAAELIDVDPEAAKKIVQASTHWLRHTHGTHAVDMDIPLPVIRDNLGHSHIAVTSQYVHADKDLQHDAFEKLSSSGDT
ncbi:site-specific integrase (plasmid) [Methylomarinum sp. Ch1-1]|uniref:Site-specific integrase n=1 Tax=Methylomarinum roseum TaxID=3067653 RepID=A0AAU7P050_9GAMM|nr:site-specific integrase [Methylomarinum sp. Ch1-1]MDP4523326.1 site-specific integrase [Methylomarinum sp. Ch1-1]